MCGYYVEFETTTHSGTGVSFGKNPDKALQAWLNEWHAMGYEKLYGQLISSSADLIQEPGITSVGKKFTREEQHG